MRNAVIFGLAALLAGLPGCSPSSAPAPAAIPAPAPAATAEKPCAGAALPITGVCTDADPSRFRAINAAFDTMSPGCKWTTREVKTSETEALVFRALDCSAAASSPSPPDAYTFANGKFQGGHSTVTLLPIPEGKTAEDVMLATLATAPEANRSRCVNKLIRESYGVLDGPSYELTPNDAFQAELEKKNDPVGRHCGDFGATGVAPIIWVARKGYVFHYDVGGDRDFLDPASLTFYRRAASGAWQKSLD